MNHKINTFIFSLSRFFPVVRKKRCIKKRVVFHQLKYSEKWTFEIYSAMTTAQKPICCGKLCEIIKSSKLQLNVKCAWFTDNALKHTKTQVWTSSYP